MAKLYTKEQLNWLEFNYKTLSRKELHTAFNERFGESRSLASIVACLKNHKLQSGRDGYFKKGQAPIYFNTKPNKTSFKAGRKPSEAHNYAPIGSERFCKDGYLERKITDDQSIAPGRRWVGVHRLNWEEAHGPIPKGHAVVFLDGDKTNQALENLRCVPRGTLARLNRQFTGVSGELRKSAVLASELEHICFDKERKSA